MEYRRCWRYLEKYGTKYPNDRDCVVREIEGIRHSMEENSNYELEARLPEPPTEVFVVEENLSIQISQIAIFYYKDHTFRQRDTVV